MEVYIHLPLEMRVHAAFQDPLVFAMLMINDQELYDYFLEHPEHFERFVDQYTIRHDTINRFTKQIDVTTYTFMGNLHRGRGLPAVIHARGRKEWYEHGRLIHVEDPSIHPLR